MNGKLRKIALGMSVLMCAGLLFTCALPANAAVNACDHMSRLYLGWDEIVEKDHYDNNGHYYTRVEQASCATCGRIFVLRSEIAYEAHDIVSTIYWNDNYAFDYCRDCNYNRTYIVLPID